MKLAKTELLKWTSVALVIFSFCSLGLKAWDGYEEGNCTNKIYINPSEKIKAGNTINFIEKSYLRTQKKKMVVERTSSSHSRSIDKIYGYINGEFVVFTHTHD